MSATSLKLETRQIFTPFRWYSDKNHQGFRKDWCVDGAFKMFEHTIADTFIPAFQIRRNTSPYNWRYFNYHDAETDVSIWSIGTTGGGGSTIQNPASMYIETFQGGFEYIINKGLTLDNPIPHVRGYFTLTDEQGLVWYSELVTPRSTEEITCRGRVEISWWGDCDLGAIHYPKGTGGTYRNSLILNCDIGEPEYEIKEEGKEDGFAVFNKTLSKTRKFYKFQIYAPEYIADALHLLPQHENIQMRGTVFMGISTEVNEVEVDIKWDRNEPCMAKIELKFYEAWVIRTGCCTTEFDLDETPCFDSDCIQTIKGESEYLSQAYNIGATETGLPLVIGDLIYVYHYYSDNGALTQGYLMRYEGRALGLPLYQIVEPDCDTLYLEEFQVHRYRLGAGQYWLAQAGAVGQVSWSINTWNYLYVFYIAPNIPQNQYLVQLEYWSIIDRMWHNAAAPVTVAEAVINGVKVSIFTIIFGGAQHLRFRLYRHDCDLGYSPIYPPVQFTIDPTTP